MHTCWIFTVIVIANFFLCSLRKRHFTPVSTLFRAHRFLSCARELSSCQPIRDAKPPDWDAPVSQTKELWGCSYNQTVSRLKWDTQHECFVVPSLLQRRVNNLSRPEVDDHLIDMHAREAFFVLPPLHKGISHWRLSLKPRCIILFLFL